MHIHDVRRLSSGPNVLNGVRLSWAPRANRVLADRVFRRFCRRSVVTGTALRMRVPDCAWAQSGAL